MQVTPKSRFYIRLQNILFVALFLVVIGIVAWLSMRYNYQADWTAGGRNTLSSASQAVLKRLEGSPSITSFATEADTVRDPIKDLIGRYQRYKPDLRFKFINPETEPERVRKLGITVNGELLIDYQGQTEKLQRLTEQNLTNALQRVARKDKPRIVFLEGHGERSSQGSANHDLSTWAHQMENKGLIVEAANLVIKAEIPKDTRVLVIAGPQVDLLPGEIKLIQGYVDKGGNLLWLGDPGPLHGLDPVAKQLGVTFRPGIIVDPTTQLFGIDNPGVTLVGQYQPNPITRNFNVITLFPHASGIALQAPKGWNGQAFLTTPPSSWSETGQLTGTISPDPSSDVLGPLDIGVNLVHDIPDPPDAKEKKQDTQQRVVVTGDGDFLSNNFLGSGGNLDLGLNIINWLSHDDSFIAISAKTAPDTALNLSRGASLAIAIGFLIFLPVALLGAGMMIWLRRRKR